MTQDRGKKGGQRVAAAGVAGAIVGASVGAATAWALTDKKNRKKLQTAAHNVSGFVQDKMKEARHQMKTHQKKAEEAIDTAAEKIKDTKDMGMEENTSKN